MSNYEFDLRQLELMLQQVNSFENGQINLFFLHTTLEYLMSVMEDLDGGFRLSVVDKLEIFQTLRVDIANGLEEAHGQLLIEGRELRSLVLAAIDEMKLKAV